MNLDIWPLKDCICSLAFIHNIDFIVTAKLEKMHAQTLARHSEMKTPEDEQLEHERWLLAQSTDTKRRKKTGPLMPCPCCAA